MQNNSALPILLQKCTALWAFHNFAAFGLFSKWQCLNIITNYNYYKSKSLTFVNSNLRITSFSSLVYIKDTVVWDIQLQRDHVYIYIYFTTERAFLNIQKIYSYSVMMFIWTDIPQFIFLTWRLFWVLM